MAMIFYEIQNNNHESLDMLIFSDNSAKNFFITMMTEIYNQFKQELRTWNSKIWQRLLDIAKD